MSATMLLLFLAVGIASASPQGGFGPDTSLPQFCGHPNFDCVPYYQCENGVINTDGSGLLDIRAKRTGSCYNPEYPHVIAVCCRIDVGSDPLDCKPPYTCVDYNLCTINQGNQVNTDGSGLINVRKNVHHSTCWTNDGAVGVCCHPPPLSTCPSTSICVDKNSCVGGQGYDFQNEFAPFSNSHSFPWHSCIYGSQNYGICCLPRFLASCPGKSECVEDLNCLGDALQENTRNSFLPYTSGTGWARCSLQGYESGGVCCEHPLSQCPQGGNCVYGDRCKGSALDKSNSYNPYNPRQTSWTSCYVNDFETGICCLPDLLRNCPGKSECVEGFSCLGDALQEDTRNSFLPYTIGTGWARCSLQGYENGGVCCEQPLLQCPQGSYCVYGDRCDGSALDKISNSYNPYNPRQTSWASCYVNDFDPGVCCQPPFVIDVCPLHDRDTSCVPFEHCAGGKVLDYNNVWLPTPNFHSPELAQCQISQYEPGVCCEPKEVTVIPPAKLCGARNYKLDTRITAGGAPGGEEANFGEFPWQCIIFDRNYTFIAGATLISNTHLLTAAHNVDKYKAGDMRIRLGEWQVNSFEEPYPYVDVDVKAVHIHHKYNPKNVHNDIALIELAYPIDFNYHINRLCLPNQGYKYQPVHGKKCVVSGWGKDSFQGRFQHILKKIDVPYIDHFTCQDLLRKTRLGRHFILDDSFVCAGGELGKDACKGDGGGPLACYDSVQDAYVVVGITSWGVGCGEKDVPGVYVNVGMFNDWIRSITGDIY